MAATEMIEGALLLPHAQHLDHDSQGVGFAGEVASASNEAAFGDGEGLTAGSGGGSRPPLPVALGSDEPEDDGDPSRSTDAPSELVKSETQARDDFRDGTRPLELAPRGAERPIAGLTPEERRACLHAPTLRIAQAGCYWIERISDREIFEATVGPRDEGNDAWRVTIFGASPSGSDGVVHCLIDDDGASFGGEHEWRVVRWNGSLPQCGSAQAPEVTSVPKESAEDDDAKADEPETVSRERPSRTSWRDNPKEVTKFFAKDCDGLATSFNALPDIIDRLGQKRVEKVMSSVSHMVDEMLQSLTDCGGLTEEQRKRIAGELSFACMCIEDGVISDEIVAALVAHHTEGELFTFCGFESVEAAKEALEAKDRTGSYIPDNAELVVYSVEGGDA